MMRWEIPLLAEIVSFWSCGLQGKARDLKPAEGQVKRKKKIKKSNNLRCYHFKKSSICKPVSCVSGARSRAWLMIFERLGLALWGRGFLCRGARALPMGWAGRTAGWPTHPAHPALQWQPCCEVGLRLSEQTLPCFQPACLVSCVALCGTTSLQKHAGRGGVTFANNFFVKKHGMNE